MKIMIVIIAINNNYKNMNYIIANKCNNHNINRYNNKPT